MLKIEALAPGSLPEPAGVRYADAVSMVRHPHEVADPTGTDTRET